MRLTRLLHLGLSLCLLLGLSVGCSRYKRGSLDTSMLRKLEKPEPPTGIEAEDSDSEYYDARADEPFEFTPEYFQPFNPEAYVVAPGDILEVSIFGHGTTTAADIPIAPDGKLYYYFLEGIPAAGRPLPEIAEEIRKGLEPLYANPEISIIPKRMTNSRFVILGKVLNPGEYYISSSIRLRQAIADAGGFMEGGYRGTSVNIASLEKSFIIRNGKKLPIDFKKLMTEEEYEHDIYVRPGDYIYIASALIQEVYLLGAVHEQRPVTFRDGMTLVSLVSGWSGDGGGYLPNAFIKRVLVIRGALEDPQVVEVNLEKILLGEANDVYLAPGDIVYVPPKRFRWLKSVVRTAVESFSRGFGGTAGQHVGDSHIWDGTGNN